MANLVLYLTINYPNRKEFFEVLDIIEEYGIGFVEIGIPVNNPVLDGKIVKDSQAKVYSSLNQEEIISVLKELRARYSFKIILMTYQEGVKDFRLCELPKETYDALLCVDADLPQEDFTGLVHIFTSELSEAEIHEKLATSAVFIYVTSGTGKTGEFVELPNEYIPMVRYVKEHTDLPVCVGFGIKNRTDILEVLGNGADGAIIGSEFIKQLNEGGLNGVRTYLNGLNS